jgi:hypothetical protein
MKLKKKIKLNQKANFYPFIYEFNKDLPKWFVTNDILQARDSKPILKNGK